MTDSKPSPLTFLKGAAMGIAEVIPGVSGGTIAFVTGIYERLLAVIKAVLGPTVLRALREGGLAAAWRAADGTFLATLLAGMATGIVVGVFGITHLLQHYPPLVWAFFFGLIVASVFYVAGHVQRWGPLAGVWLLLGAATAFGVTVATPAQGIEAPWFVFVSGTIAISALMLPGISGSFMLLLMGMYAYVLGAVKGVLKDFDSASAVTVATFAAGCLVGLATFSRVLTWLFKRHHDATMALMTGFMVGSLYKIWPWRKVLSTRINSKGEEVPFQEAAVWPMDYPGEPYLAGALALAVAGFVLVRLLDRAGRRAG